MHIHIVQYQHTRLRCVEDRECLEGTGILELQETLTTLIFNVSKFRKNIVQIKKKKNLKLHANLEVDAAGD